MNDLGRLTPQQRALLRAAAVPVLLPDNARAEQIQASAQTTTRAGATLLTAFSARIGGEVPAEPIEVVTIAREPLLASLPPSERGTAAEDAYLKEYLEREAVSALALRSLELAEGAADTLTTPLDQLISARATELPSPHPVHVRVDGTITPALRIAFGGHAATWADLSSRRVGFIVYGRADADALALTALHV